MGISLPKAYEEFSKIAVGCYMEMNTREFLDILYGKVNDGYIGISYIENGSVVTKWFHFSELDAIASYIIEEGKIHNTYYCLNPRKKRLSPYIRSSDKDVKCVVGAYADFDIKGLAHKQDALPESKEQLFDFLQDESPISPSLLIWSGNGVHAIWLFEEPYMLEGDSSYMGNVIKGWEAYLKSKAFEMYVWKFDSVADTARMLRAPGTINFKTDDRPLCEVMHYENDRYSVEDFEGYVVEQKKSNTKINVSCEEEELIGKCQFLQYCRDNAAILPEPLWQAMISNVALTADGHDKVHELSSTYPNYIYEEMEKKYRLAAANDMPITCEVIKDRGYECKNCQCGVKAPISLIREGVSKPVEWEHPISFDDFILPVFPTIFKRKVLLVTFQELRSMMNGAFCLFKNGLPFSERPFDKWILFLQLHTIFKSLAHSFSYFIITVCVRVESYSIYQ